MDVLWCFLIYIKYVFNILHVGIISLTWVLIFKQRALGRTYQQLPLIIQCVLGV